ncbi:MAG: hypothetical protein GY861_11065 [bacterium]|nr:hypothetical protein [bacterium]
MSSTTVSDQDYNLDVLASSLLQKQQHYQPIRQPEIRRPFGASTEAEQRVPFTNKDPRLQKSQLKTVRSMPWELPFVPQPTAAFLNETKYYSQVPLELNQVATLRCPKLTENEQMDFEVNLSKFLQNQQTDKSQSLTHLLQNVNLKAIPKEMLVWLEAIATVLRTMKISEEETSTLLVLIIQDMVQKSGSEMIFYWHPNFHLATDLKMKTQLPECVTFAQKNPNHPLAASQKYLNFVPVMPGWNVSYSSMAIKENDS